MAHMHIDGGCTILLEQCSQSLRTSRWSFNCGLIRSREIFSPCERTVDDLGKFTVPPETV